MEKKGVNNRGQKEKGHNFKDKSKMLQPKKQSLGECKGRMKGNAQRGHQLFRNFGIKALRGMLDCSKSETARMAVTRYEKTRTSLD